MPNAVPDAAPLAPSSDPALVARFVAGLTRQRPLGDNERIGVAVSGGPDSLALLLLADAAFPGRVEAATVDHNLRPESAAEAAMVADVCARLDVPHETLRRSPGLTSGRGVQAAARDLRYDVLRAWCGRRGLAVLTTAHHADDQAETILMRLRRGAGLGGLASIREVRALETRSAAMVDRDRSELRVARIALVRPLLDFTKAELEPLAAEHGITPISDPSNNDDGYDRTHARRLLADTRWLDVRRLAASAGHLTDAAHALDWAAMREWRERVRRSEDGEVLLAPEGLPVELLRRVVQTIIVDVEREVLGLPFPRSPPPPRGPQLTRFVQRLQDRRTATLGHVLARPGPLWRFTPAPARRA